MLTLRMFPSFLCQSCRPRYANKNWLKAEEHNEPICASIPMTRQVVRESPSAERAYEHGTIFEKLPIFDDT